MEDQKAKIPSVFPPLEMKNGDFQMKTIRFGIIICALLINRAWSQAKSDQPKDEIKTIKLTVKPAPEPSPALKYHLWPKFHEQVEGNAAQMYLMAESFYKSDNEDKDKISEWLNMPITEIPIEQVEKVIAKHLPYHQLELGAERDDCRWDLPYRKEGVTLMMPQLGAMRDLTKLLGLKIRVAIQKNQWNDALKDLRIGFVMASHQGKGKTLIENLVAISMAEIMRQRMEELIERSTSINFYWALSQLPHPFISIKEAYHLEYSYFYLDFPEIDSLENTILTKQQAADLLIKYRRSYKLYYDTEINELIIIGMYPQAREQLLAKGYTKEFLDKMPAVQTVILSQWIEYKNIRDDNFKWIDLPYYQAAEGMRKAEKFCMGEKARLNIFVNCIPAIARAKFIFTRFDRNIALLQTVEALRMQAAQDGKWPGALAEVTVVPVPEDPLHGKPFEYEKISDTQVILSSPVAGGEGVRYELTLVNEGSQK